MRRTLAVVLLNSVLSLAAGCTDPGLDRPIRFILPDEYLGKFTVVKDRNGQPVAVAPDAYVFVIPPSGELRTPDTRLFHRWHKNEFRYADGRVLADETGRSTRRVVSQGSSGGSNGDYSSSEFDGTTFTYLVEDPPAPTGATAARPAPTNRLTPISSSTD